MGVIWGVIWGHLGFEEKEAGSFGHLGFEEKEAGSFGVIWGLKRKKKNTYQLMLQVVCSLLEVLHPVPETRPG